MDSPDTTTEGGIEGRASHRTLHFIWIIDWSDSMSGTKMQKVNWAIRETLPALQKIDREQLVDIRMRAIKFGDRASWHIGPDPLPISEFEWNDINDTGGLTSTSSAIRLLDEALSPEALGTRNAPPVCILLSDGYCTNEPGKYQSSIEDFNQNPWGQKAVRLSIGIGNTATDFNKEELDLFISPYLRTEQGVETLLADSPATLVRFIKTVSTVAVAGSLTTSPADIDNSVAMPVQIHNEDFLQEEEDVLADYGQVKADEEW